MWKQLLNLLENWVLRIFPCDDPRFRQLLLEIIKQRFPHTRGVVWCMSGLFGESGSFRRWFKLIHMAHWNFIWSRLRFHDPLNDGTGQFPGIECCKSGYGNAVTFPLTSSTGNMAAHILFTTNSMVKYIKHFLRGGLNTSLFLHQLVFAGMSQATSTLIQKRRNRTLQK